MDEFIKSFQSLSTYLKDEIEKNQAPNNSKLASLLLHHPSNKKELNESQISQFIVIWEWLMNEVIELVSNRNIDSQTAVKVFIPYEIDLIYDDVITYLSISTDTYFKDYKKKFYYSLLDSMIQENIPFSDIIKKVRNLVER